MDEWSNGKLKGLVKLRVLRALRAKIVGGGYQYPSAACRLGCRAQRDPAPNG